MAALTLNNLCKSYGHVVAVNDLNLEIRDREFVTLLGPSGCGKTTTLRMIAGLERPVSGDVWFDDHPVTGLPANRRDIAMVFQSYALYPHMKVFDNIAFALKMVGVPKHEIRERVERTAGQLSIGELLQRKPRELSGGQRQRVALCRAIVRQPAAYLLDEPLSNLDAQLRVQARAELKRLHLELQGTFIYVTHDQAEALTMSDRIAVMNEGRLLQYGTPHEVYNRPTNRFVAGFIGSPSMNFLDGQLVSESGRVSFRRDSLKYELSVELAAKLDRSVSDVILGIRPESIDVLRTTTDDDTGVLRCSVYIEEPLGSDLFLTLETGGSRIKVRTTPDFPSRPGTIVGARFQPAKVHLFDAHTGSTLI